MTSRPAFSRRPIFALSPRTRTSETVARSLGGATSTNAIRRRAERSVPVRRQATKSMRWPARVPRLDDLVGAEALRGGEVTAAGRVTRDQVPVTARRGQAGGDEARHRGDVARARDAALRGRRRGAVVARCSGRDEAARHGWKRRGARGLGGGRARRRRRGTRVPQTGACPLQRDGLENLALTRVRSLACGVGPLTPE